MKFLVICIRPNEDMSVGSGDEVDTLSEEFDQQYFSLNTLIPRFFSDEIHKQKSNGAPVYQYKFCNTIDEASTFLKLCHINPANEFTIQDGVTLMKAKVDHVVLEVLDEFDPDKMPLADYILHYQVLKPEGFVYPALIEQLDDKLKEIEFLEEQSDQLSRDQDDYDAIYREMQSQLKEARKAYASLNERLDAVNAARYLKFVNRAVEEKLAKPKIQFSVTINPTMFTHQSMGGDANFMASPEFKKRK